MLAVAAIVAQDCGLQRPANQQFDDTQRHEISLETLDEADADWIFYAVQDGAAVSAEAITGATLWPGLAAVEAGRAIEVDFDTWFVNASHQSAMAILGDLRSSVVGSE